MVRINRHTLACAWNLLLQLCALVFLLLCTGHVSAQQECQTTPAQETHYSELFRLRIPNRAGAEIALSTNMGNWWRPIGRVLQPATKSAPGFHASSWAQPSSVAASAVNGLHIRIGSGLRDQAGVTFSVMPREVTNPENARHMSHYVPGASIITDIPAGSSIFGGDWTPFQSNPIYVETAFGLEPLTDNYVPLDGHAFIIIVQQPMDSPKGFLFENRFGGLIYRLNWDDTSTVIGQVLKPVCGVGRFLGGQYANAGQIRAVHSGVIDVSTGPYGKLGGFQILPRAHAMSEEMTNVRLLTQWMVVGPVDATRPSWEGLAPLYRDYLRPCQPALRMIGLANEPPERLGPLVELQLNGNWITPNCVLNGDPDAPLPAWAGSALVNVTAVRITLPKPFVRQAEPPAPAPVPTPVDVRLLSGP